MQSQNFNHVTSCPYLPGTLGKTSCPLARPRFLPVERSRTAEGNGVGWDTLTIPGLFLCRKVQMEKDKSTMSYSPRTLQRIAHSDRTLHCRAWSIRRQQKRHRFAPIQLNGPFSLWWQPLIPIGFALFLRQIFQSGRNQRTADQQNTSFASIPPFDQTLHHHGTAELDGIIAVNWSWGLPWLMRVLMWPSRVDQNETRPPKSSC